MSESWRVVSRPGPRSSPPSRSPMLVKNLLVSLACALPFNTPVEGCTAQDKHEQMQAQAHTCTAKILRHCLKQPAHSDTTPPRPQAPTASPSHAAARGDKRAHVLATTALTTHVQLLVHWRYSSSTRRRHSVRLCSSHFRGDRHINTTTRRPLEADTWPRTRATAWAFSSRELHTAPQSLLGWLCSAAAAARTAHGPHTAVQGHVGHGLTENTPPPDSHSACECAPVTHRPCKKD